MNGTKSLVESKQFWGMVLGLAAMLTKTFGLAQYASVLADPHLVDQMVSLGGFFGVFIGMFGRMSATKQVTSVFPQGAPNVKK